MSLILFYHEIKKIARKREKRIKKRLIFSSLSYIILMFHNSFFFYAAVVKLADAMDSKSIGLILRAGSTPPAAPVPQSLITKGIEVVFLVSFLRQVHIFTCYIANLKRFNYISSLDNLILLAEIFEVSLDYLLGRTD